MDELKLLIEMVAGLPALAVWVLVGYLVYKIAVIGSIYGLARFAIEKLYSYSTRPQGKDLELVLDGEAWGSGRAAFITQLRRITGRPDSMGHYLPESRAAWLSEAIDEKIARENAPKK